MSDATSSGRTGRIRLLLAAAVGAGLPFLAYGIGLVAFSGPVSGALCPTAGLECLPFLGGLTAGATFALSWALLALTGVRPSGRVALAGSCATVTVAVAAVALVTMLRVTLGPLLPLAIVPVTVAGFVIAAAVIKPGRT
ncbi:hypothetical protein ACIBH1_45780 [Nonomuraea sp. NPDC050663]|uniref:hypothetical protein n=1 Tax=Nonomuraea sp. NPDC050663 TaxID=3364370 RepID=UPI0037B515F1